MSKPGHGYGTEVLRLMPKNAKAGLGAMPLYQPEEVVIACAVCHGVFRCYKSHESKIATVDRYESTDLPISGWTHCEACRATHA